MVAQLFFVHVYVTNRLEMFVHGMQTQVKHYIYLEMTEAFTAGVMIFIEQFRARWPWSIGVLES